MKKRILVPVDFESRSRRAIRYARGLASAIGAEICLLHVMPLAPAARPTSRDKWWMTLARRTLAGFADRARLQPGTRTEVLAGDVATTIAEFASRERFDLIVISGRQTPDWHGSRLGPTALALLRHCRLPVLVVPAGAAIRIPERIPA
jgi:nucleotide-binding universal stress UspA family protein